MATEEPPALKRTGASSIEKGRRRNTQENSGSTAQRSGIKSLAMGRRGKGMAPRIRASREKRKKERLSAHAEKEITTKKSYPLRAMLSSCWGGEGEKAELSFADSEKRGNTGRRDDYSTQPVREKDGRKLLHRRKKEAGSCLRKERKGECALELTNRIKGRSPMMTSP